MPLGRPRAPGTEAERAEARRAKVRANVQAFRRRQKEKKLADAAAKVLQAPIETPEYFSEDISSLYPGGVPRVGGAILRDGYLDAGSVSTDGSVVSGRSSPGTSFSTMIGFTEQDYADPDSWIWQLTRDLASNAPYQEIFVDAMQAKGFWSPPPPGSTMKCQSTREILSYEPFRAFAGCGATWFHSVMMETVDPGLEIMNDACLASALTMTGRERRDDDMLMSASLIQGRAMRHLRGSLQSWAEGTPLCPISLSMAALTCAMSELTTTQSWANFANHLAGVGSLLSYHDPASLTTQSARELFYGYRSLEAVFAFTNARDSFVSDKRWTEFPWKREIAMSQHPMHTMLDVALEALPEIAAQHSPSAWTTSELRQRLARLRNVAAALDAWEREFRHQQPMGNLHTRKDAQYLGLYDYAFEFSSLSSATAYTMYAGVRVKLSNAIYLTLCSLGMQDRSTTGAQRSDALLQGLRWARQALQSLEYFHTGAPKDCGWITVLFAFDAAWELVQQPQLAGLVDLSKEHEWCLMTAQRFAAMEVPVLCWRA
jgi:hypothetical protein